jgi:hypothetical protein
LVYLFIRIYHIIINKLDHMEIEEETVEFLIIEEEKEEKPTGKIE